MWAVWIGEPQSCLALSHLPRPSCLRSSHLHFAQFLCTSHKSPVVAGEGGSSRPQSHGLKSRSADHEQQEPGSHPANLEGLPAALAPGTGVLWSWYGCAP